MKNALNYVLVMLMAVGLVLLIRERLNTAANRAEYERLVARYGSLNVVDRDQFFVARIATNANDSFQWRYHVPPKISLQLRTWSLNGSSAMSGDVSVDAPRLVHIRFQFDDDKILIHRLGTHGSGLSTLASGKAAEILQEHWDDLEFECQGSGALPVDHAIRFLSIRVPDRILTTLSPEFQNKLQGPLMQMVAGTRKAVDAFEAERDSSQ